MNKKIIVIISMILVTISISVSDTIIVEAEDTGWYREGGYHYETNLNLIGVKAPYLSGDPYWEYNSYLVFSIPELGNDIIELTLSLQLTKYASNDPFENIRISGVSTSIEELVVSHTNSDTGLAPWIYDDLMNGPELGVMQVDLGTLEPFYSFDPDLDTPSVFSCTLNESAINLISASEGGQFAIGLSLMDPSGVDDEHVQMNSSSIYPDFQPIRQLEIITIPEPASVLLVLAGGLLSLLPNRNKRK